MTGTHGPVALITGGASGIGAAVANLWVQRGGRVAILDMNQDAIDRVVAAFGKGSAGFKADVTSAGEVDAALTGVSDAFGGQLDAVVNCAGIARPIAAADGPDGEWARMVDIHLNGTMRVCRSAYSLLKSSDRAAIVNISSIAGAVGMSGRSSYSAAKAGIDGLTRALAVEWSPAVRVNAVAPGFVTTPLSEEMIATGKVDPAPVIARTPLARYGTTAEIASAVNFLASPEASFVTGQILRVDGGITIAGNWYASNKPGSD
ncbi:SDR family NAD(P)-dependent oxidoreductase [Rhodococcus sp. NPDC057529]|uniref:SDR family NAD(P)-dependent oxidoreductase n=1 Tax=Rhodococcus sp. NPDC057529 TaxID=3346158 RepID=UPI00366CA0C3